MGKKKAQIKGKNDKWKSWKKVRHTFELLFPSLKNEEHPRVLAVLYSLLLLGALALAIWGIVIFSTLVKPIVDIFIRNFGEQTVNDSATVFFLCICSFAAFAIVRWLGHFLEGREVKWTTFTILALTTTILLTGLVFIDSTFGLKTTWRLYGPGDIQIGSVSCTDKWGKLIEGHQIECKIEDTNLSIKEVESQLEITFNNGSNTTLYPNNKGYFSAPKNETFEVVFKANITTEENKTINAQTTVYDPFKSIEEENGREKNFLTYFLGLLFACLVTIPNIIIKVSDARRKERGEKV